MGMMTLSCVPRCNSGLTMLSVVLYRPLQAADAGIMTLCCVPRCQ